MLIYHIIITFILSFLTIIVMWNLIVLRKKNYRQIPDSLLPSVSVLIPARNEERNLKALLTSLVNQNYPNYEVILIDDNSEDKTYEIAQSFANKHTNFKVLGSLKLAEGWTGKNYTCYQLQQHAKGDYLLFTDADTIHKKNSIRKAVTAAMNENSDLLTLLPYMVMKSPWEKIIMPMLYYTVITLLPFYFVNRKGFPAFSIGIGPFMLFRRNSYDLIGGHESVKSDIVEDVRLARKVKESGMKLTVIDGTDILKVRMYRNLNEIWEGFSKNIYAGFNYNSPVMFLSNFAYMILFFLPFVFLFITLLLYSVYDILFFIIIIQVLLIYLSRIIISFRFSLGMFSSIFHPLGTLMVSLIGLNSWRWVKFSGGSKWKGRIYKTINVK